MRYYNFFRRNFQNVASEFSQQPRTNRRASPSAFQSLKAKKGLLLKVAAGAGLLALLKIEHAPDQWSQDFTSGMGLGWLYYHFGSLTWDFIDPEVGHIIAIKGLALPHSTRARLGLVNNWRDNDALSTNVCGMQFHNPVGIAAGFDKNGEAIDGLIDTGFGFVEIGSVTPVSQPGNPQPRVFRMVADKAIINRYGFNSQGADEVAERLAHREAEHVNGTDCNGRPWEGLGIVGINLGKNKTSVDAAQDYITGIEKLGRYGRYLVINVSSPNTPGLRALQAKETLQDLLLQVKAARDKLEFEIGASRPIFLKIAPDITEEDKKDIAEVSKSVGIDGLIVSNTTVTRSSSLQSQHKVETGGLSGAPIRDASTQLIRDMYTLTGGQIPIIGVGGIFNGQDAYEKIRAGASLVQLYTGFAYQGPVAVKKMKWGLLAHMHADGYDSISQVVGADHRLATPQQLAKKQKQKGKQRDTAPTPSYELPTWRDYVVTHPLYQHTKEWSLVRMLFAKSS